MEVIVVSDDLIFAHTRYRNEASMEEAEPNVREVLEPVTKHCTTALEQSLAIGGMVRLAGKQAWMLSTCPPPTTVASVISTILPQDTDVVTAYVPVPEGPVDENGVNGGDKN